MAFLGCFQFLVATAIFSAQASPTGVPLNYGSVLGLQRGLNLQKKAFVFHEDADEDKKRGASSTMETSQRSEIENRKDVKDPKALGDDELLSLVLEADDADSPDWLENSALGLQRGFEVTKKPTKPSPKRDGETTPASGGQMKTVPAAAKQFTNLGLQRGFQVTKAVVSDPDEIKNKPDAWKQFTGLGLQRGFQVKKAVVTDPDDVKTRPAAWKQFTSLGLQRGFEVKKAVVSDPEDLDTEGIPTPSWQDATALGLQRGFHVEKKAVRNAEAPPQDRNSTAASSQRRRRGVSENSSIVV